jgi:hypothetical protein
MTDGAMTPATPRAARGTGEMRSLVLRAWLEPGSPLLRVRVVEIVPGRGERLVIVTTSVDETCRAVRGWLETLHSVGTSENGDGTVTHMG